MYLSKTSAPSELQLKEIVRLVEFCRIHDRIRLSYPSEEIGDGCCHYLLYTEDGILAAALALIELDHEFSECSAFTHPDYRRRGCFTRLFTAALEEGEERDILFAVCENCPDTMAALDSLGADLESREHQMELELPPCDPECGITSPPLRHPEVTITSSISDGSSIWKLHEKGTAIGHCMLTPVSPTCACLHHVEIEETLRGHGYGSDFLALLFLRLSASGIRKVILQVSDGNPAALSLYRKTGFRLTETLSYYWY